MLPAERLTAEPADVSVIDADGMDEELTLALRAAGAAAEDLADCLAHGSAEHARPF